VANMIAKTMGPPKYGTPPCPFGIVKKHPRPRRLTRA
jgi:hypothetical protein